MSYLDSFDVAEAIGVDLAVRVYGVRKVGAGLEFGDKTYSDMTLLYDQIQEDLDACEAEIDSYVGTRYTTPVTTPAAAVTLLRSFTALLLREMAYQRMPGSEVPDGVAAAAARVRGQLAGLAAGETTLSGAPTDDEAADELTGGIEYDGRDDAYYDDDELGVW